MPVYVDEVMNHGGSATFRWKDSCHMYADTLDELHAFARKIGLKRAWFQDKRVPHYDLNASRHRVAIQKGAVQHTRRQAVDFWTAQGWHSRRLQALEFEGEPAPAPPPPVAASLFEQPESRCGCGCYEECVGRLGCPAVAG